MLGIHTFWTLPKKKEADGSIVISEVEMVTWLLSALMWRKINGPIKLVTDHRGSQFAKRTGLIDAYDSTATWLDDWDCRNRGFWSCPKIFSAAAHSAPFATLDMDAIVWRRLSHGGADCYALHPEGPACYRENKKHFARYGFSQWDFSPAAANTGVVGFLDDELRKFYTSTALGFIALSERDCRKYKHPNRDWEYSLFADQKLLTMCAAKLRKSIRYLVKTNSDGRVKLWSPITHLWDTKPFYSTNPYAAQAYVNRSVEIVDRDFPDFSPLLKRWGIVRRELAGARETVRLGGHDLPLFIRDTNLGHDRPMFVGDVRGPSEVFVTSEPNVNTKTTNELSSNNKRVSNRCQWRRTA